MRHDPHKLLWDMMQAAERISSFAASKSFEDFRGDALLRSGIERQFEILGEAMTRLIQTSPTIAQQFSDYRKIVGFRNALIHGYDVVDDEVTWGIVQQKLPRLREEIERLLPPSGA
jgi:uncharacterized protein with HEPN domain